MYVLGIKRIFTFAMSGSDEIKLQNLIMAAFPSNIPKFDLFNVNSLNCTNRGLCSNICITIDV